MNLPDRKYRVILADPPWAYRSFSDKKHGAARSHYQCMTPAELKALPVGDLAEDNCALFMWVTFPKLAMGAHLPLLEAWGFRPVTTAFVWLKSFSNGAPYVGLGFYTRSAAEPVVLAIRGRMPRAEGATNVSQLIEAKRKRHSEKPDEIYDRIEELYPEGPYLELFARRPREGWDGWGNEYPC